LSARAGFDAGFLACRDVAPDGSARMRALGPFYESQVATNGMTFLAVRPFYSRTWSPEPEKRRSEYLWPVGMSRDFVGDRMWRVLQTYNNRFQTNAPPPARHRFVCFPFLYYGTDIHAERYFAVFPLGGTIHEFIGRDRIQFALFPLWTHSTINEVETYDYMWPIVSYTQGGDIYRFRIFPLYMRSVAEGEYDKHSVLWPIWNYSRYCGRNREGWGFILFPLVGASRTEAQRSWMLFPPFFRYAANTNGYRDVRCPWPFVKVRNDPVHQESSLQVWPLWGRTVRPTMRSSYGLWPLFFAHDADRDAVHFKRRWAVPLVYYCRRTVRTETGEVPPANDPREGVFFRLWPLLSHERNGDVSRTRLLSLWPGSDVGSIERNYAPLWTLYSSVRDPKVRESEFLWGLYRHRKDVDGARRVQVFPLFAAGGRSGVDGHREFSILKGLFGYQRHGMQREYRLLYLLNFGNPETTP
jgi:hypothetical protein